MSNQVVKNRRPENRSSTQSFTNKVEETVGHIQNEWTYEKIMKVGAAVVTILSVMLNKKTYQKIEEFGNSIASILGVESIQDWEPPKELLKRLGIKTESQMRYAA